MILSDIKMRFLNSSLWWPLLLLPAFHTRAQQALPLSDLSFWKNANAKNWQIAGDAQVDISKHDAMTAAPGTGVLLNLPDANNRSNLLSVSEFGDMSVSFDFMMAVHSNSGFYLQGRYEVQLMDSWGVQQPSFGDCGGIYARRRWNPSEQLFDGHPPRQNACLAPGLWQHMEIRFQAPRFDASGKKTAHARLLKVALNGLTIHENLELTGPTGGPISEQEAATGPIMIQGDHGPVAFRNIQINDLRGQPVSLSGPVSYRVIYGDYRTAADFAGKKADLEGTTEKLSWEVAKKENSFATVFTGKINVPQAGKYHLTLQTAGYNYLKVNGKEVLSEAWTYSANQRSAELELLAGPIPFELANYKMDGWMPPYLGFWIGGASSPDVELHLLSSTLSLVAADPIYLDATEPKVFRSFMDITLPNSQRGEHDFMGYQDPHRKRIVHAVQVGHPTHLHYTYDLDNGAVAQIWKGGFLNVSPMWDNRGDGSSAPRGAVLPLDDIQPVVEKSRLFDLSTAQNDPAPGFRPRGYDLDAIGQPSFRYLLASSIEVEDQLRISEGKTIARTLTFNNLPSGHQYVVRLAVGKSIEKNDDTTWSVDGHRYFIQTPNGAKPTVETSGGLSVLYLPASARVEYGWRW